MKNSFGIRSAAAALLVLALCSFTKFGGDSYSIHLNDKLLLQHYVHSDKEAKSISLSNSDAQDLLSIRYSHCGKIGSDRVVTLRDSRDQVVKTIQYPDVAGETALSMTVKVQDVFAASRSINGKSIRIHYASKELAKGITLTTIDFGNGLKASLH